MKTKALVLSLMCIASLGLSSWVQADPQTTFFTYQAQLQENGAPATGTYDFQFQLYDDPAAGAQVGPTVLASSYTPTGGFVNLDLDFGAAFTGTQLYLQVTINDVTITPRTPVRLEPVSEFALSAASASSVTAGSINTAALANTTVARAKLAGGSGTGNIGFSLGAGACGTLTLSISSAQVGDLVVIGIAGGTTPPSNIVFGPLSVVSAGSIKAQACNLGSTSFSTSALPVTIQTFR